jgi:ribosome maturation factor RimP
MYSEEIQNLISQKFQEEGFQDCFLVAIEQQNNAIRVYIDSDSGINFENCQKISRYLESVFDENSWFGENYVLEVSSPGISRPLKFPRQYLKNKGRELDVVLLDGSKITGEIVEVTETGITLNRTETRKEGKKKIKELIETQIDYKTIREAKIVIKI